MKMDTATQRMRYDLLLTLYEKASGNDKLMEVYTNHKLEPIMQRHCWAMPINDAVEICQDNEYKNMADLVCFHIDELFRFWPTTMNTHSVGIALELARELTDENFSKEQLNLALRMSKINLSNIAQAFGSGQYWSIIFDHITNETRRIMDFVLNGTIQEK